MPSLTHHTASCDKLPKPTLAKGGPLSVRMVDGSPYSRKACSSTLRASRWLGCRSPSHTNRYREAASCTVKGSIRVLSPVRNHPLKSIDHTSLGLSAAANGSLQGAACRRRFRRFTSPARSRISPAVLDAGHDALGSAFRSDATTFLGPQFGWARLTPITRSATAKGVLFGRRIGARLRSPHSLKTIGPVPIHPLVSRLTAYTEPSAQRHEAHFPPLPPFQELFSLFLRTRLFPGQHTPPDGIGPIFAQCVTHVSGLSVTNVSGLYPPDLDLLGCNGRRRTHRLGPRIVPFEVQIAGLEIEMKICLAAQYRVRRNLTYAV